MALEIQRLIRKIDISHVHNGIWGYTRRWQRQKPDMKCSNGEWSSPTRLPRGQLINCSITAYLPEGKRKRHPSREISLGSMCEVGPTMLGFLFRELFALRWNGELATSKLLLAFSASSDHEIQVHLLLWERLTRDRTWKHLLKRDLQCQVLYNTNDA